MVCTSDGSLGRTAAGLVAAGFGSHSQRGPILSRTSISSRQIRNDHENQKDRQSRPIFSIAGRPLRPILAGGGGHRGTPWRQTIPTWNAKLTSDSS